MANPDYRAYTVVKREGKDDYWLSLGVAFRHEDGEGEEERGHDAQHARPMAVLAQEARPQKANDRAGGQRQARD